MPTTSKNRYTIMMQVYSRSLEAEIRFKTIHEFSVVKSPFTKTAPLTYITVEHDEVYLMMLDKEVRVNALPQAQVIIYLGGEEFQSLTYYIVGSFEEHQQDSSDFSAGVRKFTYILVNPVLYWLENNHSFVQILSGTAASAIEKFETHLTDTFDDIFDKNKYVEDPNPFSYGTILTRSDNDLKVPYELFIKYKAYPSLGYYFFDDFNIRSDKAGIFNNIKTFVSDIFTTEPKPISLNSFTFGGVDQLQKIDLFENSHMDGQFNVKVKSSISAMDGDFQVNPDTAVVHLPTSKSQITVPNSSIFIPSLTQHSTPSSFLINDRKISSSKTSLTSADSSPRSYVSLYAPDNAEMAVGRFNDTKWLKQRQIRSYMDVELDDVSYDLIKLNEIYNLNDKSNFEYIPMIVHYKFVPNQEKTHGNTLICNISSVMCEFIP